MSQAKVAVVVGVGPGLGSAIAHKFASENFAVGLIARNADQLTEIQSEIQTNGGTALIFPADVTDAASIKDAFAQIKSQLDAPEVLVYNAGAFQMAGILELTPEQFENSWKVNCFGAFVAAQQILPAMVEQGRGTILLTGATAALKGSARFSALAVGKFGLRALAQSLAREFGPQGIHVAHIVIDGMINTERVRGMIPEREEHTLLSPEAIAQNYWQLYNQDTTAWTLELDLRPAVEKF
ncbi:short-chain dehydrogenase/reductase SDR [Tolypothrix sp. NIES-4075]|uniref:SDR family NAD(P)-dependent oxidoreductase n=1 Tax=Tolypothrix sp. NIES-4075 TaxID=2005459 RepID=UPI000B5C7001|nr:SDR family NAD(P)-dependent oxidoreductase [Tolypothrix sp. NIES-4075]GAX43099.1 short-chain dehydrogenase/reductase SDR [Tolypothrix sp. NIES-4075]